MSFQRYKHKLWAALLKKFIETESHLLDEDFLQSLVPKDLTRAEIDVEPDIDMVWIGSEMSSMGPCVWIIGLQCVFLFWEAVEASTHVS